MAFQTNWESTEYDVCTAARIHRSTKAECVSRHYCATWNMKSKQTLAGSTQLAGFDVTRASMDLVPRAKPRAIVVGNCSS